MKLYYVDDGPPSMSVRLALKVLEVPHELISIDYMAGEHTTEEYAKVQILQLAFFSHIYF